MKTHTQSRFKGRCGGMSRHPFGSLSLLLFDRQATAPQHVGDGGTFVACWLRHARIPHAYLHSLYAAAATLWQVEWLQKRHCVRSTTSRNDESKAVGQRNANGAADGRSSCCRVNNVCKQDVVHVALPKQAIPKYKRVENFVIRSKRIIPILSAESIVCYIAFIQAKGMQKDSYLAAPTHQPTAIRRVESHSDYPKEGNNAEHCINDVRCKDASSE